MLGDEPVFAALRHGDVDAACTSVVEGYGPAVLGYLCTLLDDDDAADAFSLFAEDVWRGIAGFRQEGSLRAWVYRIAWRAAAQLRREAYRRRREPLRSSIASRIAASVVASSRMPGGRRDDLRRLRDMLDPEDQTLLVLRVDRELEWEEIAAVLTEEGAPASSAALRKRFERLKERLADLARERGMLE